MGLVPRPQGGVALRRVDADEQAAHRGEAGRAVLAVAAAHAEALRHLGAEIVDPFADRLVAAHAAERRGGGQGQHRGQRMAPTLPAAGIVNVLEELGEGSHPCGAQRHLGHSMSQAGVEMGGSQPGSRAPAQGMKEHKLRVRVLAVAVPVAGEAAGASYLDPVGGAVDGALEVRRVHEGLRQKQVVAEAGRPVVHQTARAQREHPRAEVALTAGEDQKARVVGDEVQTADLDAIVPADPTVARPALQRRRREHRQRQPAPLMVSDIAHSLAHPWNRAEIVVRLHQVAEAGLVLHRHDVDSHFRKSHHGFLAPTVASRYSYQDVDRKFSIAVKSLSGGAKAQSTNPSWCRGRATLTRSSASAKIAFKSA